MKPIKTSLYRKGIFAKFKRIKNPLSRLKIKILYNIRQRDRNSLLS